MSRSDEKTADMATLPPDDTEVVRYNAYQRLNPKGDRELVVRRKGRPDEETLNELSDYISDLIGDIGLAGVPARRSGAVTTPQTATPARSSRRNCVGPSFEAAGWTDLPDKYITDCADNGSGHRIANSESFVGTAGIAAAPSGVTRRRRRGDDVTTTLSHLETSMNNENVNDRGETISEWSPEFAGGDYDPGDHEMVKPGGKGVADRNVEHDRVGAYDTEMTDHGRAWPRRHNETAAMCDVDDDGVENEPQGVHDSTHGKPDDGIQSELGHDWPDEPHNSVRDATDARTKRMDEDWSPSRLAQMMGDDEADIQDLFDAYARSVDHVCVEDFQNLCNAHGLNVVLDETSLLRLMDANREFIFYEKHDSDGPYWTPCAVSDADRICRPVSRRNEDGRARRKDRTFAEMQIRSPEQEAELYKKYFPPGDPDYSPDYDEALSVHRASHSPFTDKECPGCGYCGIEDICPECGIAMVSPDEEDLPDPRYSDTAYDDLYSEDCEVVLDQHIVESLRKFMTSARNIIERNQTAEPRDLAEALNYSWQFYAGDVDARTCPTKVKRTLAGLMHKFPGFNPLIESAAMDRPRGTALGGGDGPDDGLPEQPTRMKTHGNKNLLRRKQSNGAMAVAGNGDDRQSSLKEAAGRKGAAARVPASIELTTRIMKENVARLSKYVKRKLQEGAKYLKDNPGKYDVFFTLLVRECDDRTARADRDDGKNRKRTPPRDRLAEALADAEEILQAHPAEDVTLEANFRDANGLVIFKHDIPLFTIQARGPMVSEGQAIFRFRRTAEAFAEQLVMEGVSCRLTPHNWGAAVQADVDYSSACRAFSAISAGTING